MTLFDLLGLLRKHLLLLIILPALCGGAAFVWARFLPDQYSTSTTMYVLTRSDEREDLATSVTQQELSLSSMITNDVVTIINSSRVRNNVSEKLGVGIGGYAIEVTQGNSSRVIKLSVSGRDPEMCATIANAIVEESNVVASQIMQIQAINVIDLAEVPQAPSGPQRSRYVLMGAAAGLFAAVAIIIVRDLLDTRVRNGKEAEEIVGVPVVGHYPEFD